MVIQGLQGATTALFGHSEGINEHGLAVSQSSCGFPVSNLPQMRNPGIKGLQFWAVIRSLLENCKTVDEALSMLTGMPIAYNINLYLADAAGEIALYETMNGEAACERIGAGNKAMAYFFDEWFGTVRSVVMDVEERRYSVCWLGQKENGWDEFYVNQELKSHQKEAVMEREFAEPGTFDMIPIPQIQG